MSLQTQVHNVSKKQYKQRIVHYTGASFLVCATFLMNLLNWLFVPELPLEWVKTLIFFTYVFRPSLFPWLFFAPFTLMEDFFLSLTFGTTLFNCIIFAGFITFQLSIIRKLNFFGSWAYFLFLLIVFEVGFYIAFSDYTLQKIPTAAWLSIFCTWLIYPVLMPALNLFYRRLVWLGYFYGGR